LMICSRNNRVEVGRKHSFGVNLAGSYSNLY
jgi:hypothetical protein